MSIQKYKEKTLHQLTRLFEFFRYPLAAAVFLLLAFPGFNLWFFAWFALVPMMLHVSRCRGWKEAFFSGFTTGILFFAGLLYWIPRTVEAYGGVPPGLAVLILILACMLLACFFALFSLIMFYFFRRWSWKAFLLSPFVWVFQEFARNHLALTGFGWGSLGTSQVAFGYMIQIADMMGVYGVSFLLVAINTVILLALAGDVPQKLNMTWAAVVAVCLLYALVYAEFRYLSFSIEDGTRQTVAGIQGNIREEDGFERIRKMHMKVYPEMLDNALAADPDIKLVVFPENPVTSFYETDSEYRELLRKMALKHQVYLLVNGIHYENDETYYNSMYCIGPDGQKRSVYDKIRLVPFAEHVPFQPIFFFARSMSREISNFQQGDKVVVHSLDGSTAGAFICYESIFPDLVRSFTQEGAQFLINITNDAWFGRTAAPLQHFQHVILRAVENRRWIVRVANSGSSAIINPMGRVTQIEPLDEKRIMTGEIFALTEKSPYVVVGDAFAWFCVAIIIIILGKIFIGRYTKNDTGGSEEQPGEDPKSNP